MAESNKPNKKKLVVARKRETVRERADKSTKKSEKAPRTRKLATSAMKPVAKVGTVLKKEYTPIKTGNSKVGKALSKRQSLTPGYFVEAFKELKLVTWPTKKTAAKLTFAVAAFCVVLATVIKLLDYGFDKLFKNVILK